jgi:acetoin utilization deacetylase AcuC-like enzyme
MKIVQTDAHRAHAPRGFLLRGAIAESPEKPERAERLLAAVRERHELLAPREHGPGPVAAVHSPEYLGFLKTAHAEWSRIRGAGPEVIPNVHPGRRMASRPRGVVGLAGWHMADGACPIGAGTWAAARAGADCALTAADLVLAGERRAYALCRPPGHHAFADMAGGFCFLNNVAVAAQHMLGELRRVAILDVDVHHGNGTQDIFYARRDVFFCSLHGDPATFYPFFAGHAHERGTGEGEGYNLNLPLAHGTGDDGFLAALGRGLAAIRSFAPEALLVSLGLDAQERDPLGVLKVTTAGFGRVAAQIAGLGLPTVLVQEGGYLCDDLGPNLASFLEGFEAAHS